jgi:hypothetical protein
MRNKRLALILGMIPTTVAKCEMRALSVENLLNHPDKGFRFHL